MCVWPLYVCGLKRSIPGKDAVTADQKLHAAFCVVNQLCRQILCPMWKLFFISYAHKKKKTCAGTSWISLQSESSYSSSLPAEEAFMHTALLFDWLAGYWAEQRASQSERRSGGDGGGDGGLSSAVRNRKGAGAQSTIPEPA